MTDESPKPKSSPAVLPYGRHTRRPATLRQWLILGTVVVTAIVSLGRYMRANQLGPFRPRETACCIKCGPINLRQIGLALQVYAQEHQGALPSNLGELAATTQIGIITFVCPSSTDEVAKGSTEEIAASISSGKNCSYIYVGQGAKWPADPKRILLFEDPVNHGMDGGNVLLGNGKVEFWEFEKIVQVVPELASGRNPPHLIPNLTPPAARTLYANWWLPRLKQLKDGSWPPTSE